MSYTIHNSSGTAITIADNALDVAYYNGIVPPGIGVGQILVGRNTIDYGSAIAQNFLQLTENFSSVSAPSDTTSLQGQLWFNKSSSTTGSLFVRVSDATSGGLANWQKLVTVTSTETGTSPVVNPSGTPVIGDLQITGTGASLAVSVWADAAWQPMLISNSTIAPSLIGTNFSGIPNSALVGSGIVTIGTTNIALGATSLTLAGLTSVTSTAFVGSLNGNAATATNAAASNFYIPSSGQAGDTGGVLVSTGTEFGVWANGAPGSMIEWVRTATPYVLIAEGGQLTEIRGPLNASSTISSAGAITAPQFNGYLNGNAAAATIAAMAVGTNGGGTVFLANGSAGAPSLSFVNDPVQDTGLYWGGDGIINFTSSGQLSGSIAGGDLVMPRSVYAVVSINAPHINGITVGLGALSQISNTALGYDALFSNTGGYNITASGSHALFSNTTGVYNTATGCNALVANTIGSYNTATGASALVANTIGDSNTAIGDYALADNTTGQFNTAVGSSASLTNTAGSHNTAIGSNALVANTTGSYNTAIGYGAFMGNTSGSGNIALCPYNSNGAWTPVYAAATANDSICMGSTGVTNAYIQVAWTVVSDARDKTDFAPVPHGLEFVKQLKPTAYRYKMSREDIDGHGPIRYGFKAQDVLALEGTTPVIVDAEDPDKLRFNDQSMLAVLVNAIQELKAEFDAYKLTHP